MENTMYGGNCSLEGKVESLVFTHLLRGSSQLFRNKDFVCCALVDLLFGETFLVCWFVLLAGHLFLI